VIDFHCPGCRRPMRAPPEKAGATGTCPHCRTTLRVPVPLASPVAPPAAAPPVAPPVGVPVVADEARPPRRKAGPGPWVAVLVVGVASAILLAGGAFALYFVDWEGPPTQAKRAEEDPPPRVVPRPPKPPKPRPPAPKPPDPEPPAPPPVKPVIYPADGQTSVPLMLPGMENPNPIPLDKDLRGGYPVTVTFPRDVFLSEAEGSLEVDGGKAVPVWFSSEQTPANPDFPRHQRNTICLIAKDPLRPATRYAVKVRCKVDNEPWESAWSFRTVSEEEVRKQVGDRALALLNEARTAAGLKPVTIDPETTPGCMAHALYVARHYPVVKGVNLFDEDPKLEGYTKEGKEIAKVSYVLSGGEPERLRSVLAGSMTNRIYLLNPEMEKLGLGYAPAVPWGYVWVLKMPNPPVVHGEPEAALYPGPGQKGVPLVYPVVENPDPIPKEGKGKAGFAITAGFPVGTRIRRVEAELKDDKEEKVDCWLFTPENPATRFPQLTICLLPKDLLTSATTYQVRMRAEVHGRRWEKAWAFTTRDVKADRARDVRAILDKVNAARRQAGVGEVALDEKLSRACQSHAEYLARHAGHPSLQGLGVHDEDPKLAGYTKEGQRSAQGSVITDVSFPHNTVDGWLATLYHRIPILDPNLKRIGVGYVRKSNHNWVTVMDVANGM
jgi:uncharacterized protein YkwD